MTVTAQLDLSCDFERILRDRQRLRDTLEQLAAIGAECDFGEDASVVRPRLFSLDGRGNYCQLDGRGIDEVMAASDAHTWDYLLRKSALWRFMDSKARSEWRDTYKLLSFPPLTEANFIATFERLHSDRKMMVARSVEELFSQMSGEHVSNNVRQFSCRHIYRHAYRFGSVDYRFGDMLDDLQRILILLRGEPETPQNALGILRDAVDDRASGVQFCGGRFSVRLFKGTGTAWINLHEQLDIDNMNAMLSIVSGGAALPPQPLQTSGATK